MAAGCSFPRSIGVAVITIQCLVETSTICKLAQCEEYRGLALRSQLRCLMAHLGGFADVGRRNDDAATVLEHLAPPDQLATYLRSDEFVLVVTFTLDKAPIQIVVGQFALRGLYLFYAGVV